MKVKSLQIALVILAAVFGGIGLSAGLGLWETTNDKVPAKYTEGTAAGQYNPADIKGSYTFNDIQEAFGVPVEDLGNAFGVKDPGNSGAFQCKELETMYAALAAEGKEVGTGSVRYFVALYRNLPFEAEEGTYLPATAVEVLKTKGNLTDEQLDEISKITVETAVTPQESPAKTPADTPASEPAIIKGSTTFKEILAWGVTQEEIEKTIGSPLPDSGMIMKDYATEKGVEFSTWKDALQKIIDKKIK